MNQITTTIMPKEVNSLIELRGYLSDSIDHINRVMNNDDVETNLDYIVRDWNVEPHRRNEVIKSNMEVLQSALNRIESESTDQ